MSPRRDRCGAWLLVGLLVISIAAFGFTRALRSEDDIVNSVEISESGIVGGPTGIEFTTTQADERADVLVITVDGQQVRALQLGEPLPAGRQEFVWDGRTDDGSEAPFGTYRLRIILGEAGRDIEPGPIEFDAGVPSALGGAGDGTGE